MYNFGRVTRETVPERYRDSSEMGMVLGCFGAFSPNFITQVSGEPSAEEWTKECRKCWNSSLPESATKFRRYSQHQPWASVMTVISGWQRKRNGRVTAPMPRLT